MTWLAERVLTEGVTTEYSDAWLEGRQAEFGNVVRNTAMAVAGDVLLRGAFLDEMDRGGVIVRVTKHDRYACGDRREKRHFTADQQINTSATLVGTA